MQLDIVKLGRPRIKKFDSLFQLSNVTVAVVSRQQVLLVIVVRKAGAAARCLNLLNFFGVRANEKQISIADDVLSERDEVRLMALHVVVGAFQQVNCNHGLLLCFDWISITSSVQQCVYMPNIIYRARWHKSPELGSNSIACILCCVPWVS